MTSICRLCRMARYMVLGAVVGSAGPAGAQLERASRHCRRLQVDADAALLGRFPELPGRVRWAFTGRNDTDACARVWLHEHQGGIEIEVRLGDGRSAARLVPHARDVVPTLQGLLLLPEPGPQTEPATVTTTESEPLPQSEPDSEPSRQIRARPPARKPPRPRPSSIDLTADQPSPSTSDDEAPLGWGIEASLIGAAHIGDRQTRSSVGGLCIADLWGWLAGFELRAADYTPQPGTAIAPYSTVEFALRGGHRFRLEPVALDFTAGPTFMLNSSESVVSGPSGTRRSSSTELVTRLRLASHLNFAPRSLVGPFVGVEGELGPAERSDTAAPAPGAPRDPEYPGWMVGIVLGATVGSR